MSMKSKKIKSISKRKASNWVNKAAYLIENKKWLGYSSQIAMRALAIIEDNISINQSSLAKSLNVSPQQISKILKGKQNLTLKTIGKLSDELGFELISFPPYKDSFVMLYSLETPHIPNSKILTEKIKTIGQTKIKEEKTGAFATILGDENNPPINPTHS